MDGARAVLVGRLLRILVLAFALGVAIEALDFRGPDPRVPRYVLDVPSEHELDQLKPAPLRGGPISAERPASRWPK